MPPRFHLAQVNIARLRAPIDDPLLAGFVERPPDSLDPVPTAGFADPCPAS